MTAAPFNKALALGPKSAEAHWLHADDGVRLRAAIWPDGASGTILLFPGRTEYLEKYGLAAADLNASGLAVAAVDWRGQGLSDRVHIDPLAGHVKSFRDYQRDVAPLLAHVRERGLPQPYHLLAHSMGGAIGLRSLHEGLPVASAVFSAPMWGIGIAPKLRPFAWAMAWVARALRLSHRYAPGTAAAPYVEAAPFEGNLLTTDREMFAYIQRQTREMPELRLGGPSLNWLIEALGEARALRRLAPPAVPTYVAFGSDERIVDPAAIRALVERWPGAQLELFEGARHELMMERPAIRGRFLAAAIRHTEMRGSSRRIAC